LHQISCEVSNTTLPTTKPGSDEETEEKCGGSVIPVFLRVLRRFVVKTF
jgi:hypothetical protein